MPVDKRALRRGDVRIDVQDGPEGGGEAAGTGGSEATAEEYQEKQAEYHQVREREVIID